MDLDLEAADHLLEIVTGLTPIVFVVHNLDELRDFDKFSELYFRRFKISRRSFGIVTATLSVAVAVACYGTLWHGDSEPLRALTRAIFAALALNAFQHVALSITLRRSVPGLLSAALLLGPFSITGLTISAWIAGEGFFLLACDVARGALLLVVSIAGGVTLPALAKRVLNRR